MEHYKPMKMSKKEPTTESWLDLRNTILSERSLIKKNIYGMTPPT